MKYKIDFKHQLKSIKRGLVLLFISAGFCAALTLCGIIPFKEQDELLLIVGLFNLVLFSPAIFLHFQYYFKNKNTELEIFSDNFKITNGNIIKTYKVIEIVTIERHLGILHKNEIDKAGRRPSPWSDYGYLKVKFTDGHIYYFTSLMIDVKKPPMKMNTTKYRFIQYLDKDDISVSEKRKWIEGERKEKENLFLEKFSDMPKESLIEKVKNKDDYEPEAILAAKTILKERHGIEINQ